MTNKTTSAIDPVERVARAICSASGDHWFGSNAYAKENERWFKLARAAIEAQSDTITLLKAALTDAEEVMSAAMVMIGARNDTLTEAQRQGNVNQAWHRLKSGREALRSSVGARDFDKDGDVKQAPLVSGAGRQASPNLCAPPIVR